MMNTYLSYTRHNRDGVLPVIITSGSPLSAVDAGDWDD